MVPLPCDVPRRTTTVGRKVQSCDGNTRVRLTRRVAVAGWAGTPGRPAAADAPADRGPGPCAAIASGPAQTQRPIPAAVTSGIHIADRLACAGRAPTRRRFAPMIDRGSFPHPASAS